ncbi:MAG TPA: ABC transporter permease [Syntrophales bacterium]|nr:ABC transporter permease [Syntrophales bacterium]
MQDFVGYLGKQTRQRLNRYADQSALFYSILRQIVVNPRAGRSLRIRIIVEQIYFTAVEALWIVIPIALLIGSGMILQLAGVAAQYDLGRITVIMLIREFGPLITALIVILRSATAMTIETGYMNVLHEIEAMELQGMDPLDILSVPRMIGITVSMVCLITVFSITSVLGGYAIAWTLTTVPLQNFLSQIGKAITGLDIVVVALKAIFFGMGITVISLHYGMSIEKGITDIPVAASRGAVACLFYCLAVNFILFAAFFL